MTRTLIAACGSPIVARLRKTFPAVPTEAQSPAMRRRGRLLSDGELMIAELPPIEHAGEDEHAGPPESARTVTGPAEEHPGTDITGELAFYLGALPTCSAVLMVVPLSRLVVADRIIAPGRRELIPDLLEPTSRFDDAVRVEPVTHPAVWPAADWALRRFGPHQFWVVGLPAGDNPGAALREGAIHRGLRSVVAALEQQNR